jgi:hypothetical protein
LISLVLNNKERLDDIQILSNSDIDDLVDTHFILTGEWRQFITNPQMFGLI